MTKVDFKKEWKHLYQPKKTFEVVDVPAMNFLMIDGHGDPNVVQEYRDAVETLFPAAYAIKFLSKTELDRDYVVPPLEGLWWAEDMDAFTTARDKSQWDWTMMIMTPDWITPEIYRPGLERAGKKSPPALDKIRLESYHEGLSVQIMHIGPYEDEGPTLARLHHEFIPANGYRMAGKHHEIYLGDPRKTAPEKLKTVLRQPVRKSE